MADNVTMLSSIPSRLLEDNSGSKATPRRGLTEYRNTPGGPSTDKKATMIFGGQTHTPTGLQGSFSTKRKTSTTLSIYEDPPVTKAVLEMGKDESIVEAGESVDTCNRDPTRDEESIVDVLGKRESLRLFEGTEIEEYKTATEIDDDDAKTLIFCIEEDSLSIYSISSESDCWSEEEEEEEDESGVGRYFFPPYDVANTCEEQWQSLKVDAHESDTEAEAEAGEGVDTCNRDPTRDEESIVDALGKRESLVLFEGTEIEEYKTATEIDDDDAKTLKFCIEEDSLSIYSISSESDIWSEEEEEEEDESGVGHYFFPPYDVANSCEEQWQSLMVGAHESDTELEVPRC